MDQKGLAEEIERRFPRKCDLVLADVSLDSVERGMRLNKGELAPGVVVVVLFSGKYEGRYDFDFPGGPFTGRFADKSRALDALDAADRRISERWRKLKQMGGDFPAVKQRLEVPNLVEIHYGKRLLLGPLPVVDDAPTKMALAFAGGGLKQAQSFGEEGFYVRAYPRSANSQRVFAFIGFSSPDLSEEEKQAIAQLASESSGLRMETAYALALAAAAVAVGYVVASMAMMKVPEDLMPRSVLKNLDPNHLDSKGRLKTGRPQATVEAMVQARRRLILQTIKPPW